MGDSGMACAFWEMLGMVGLLLGRKNPKNMGDKKTAKQSLNGFFNCEKVFGLVGHWSTFHFLYGHVFSAFRSEDISFDAHHLVGLVGGIGSDGH